MAMVEFTVEPPKNLSPIAQALSLFPDRFNKAMRKAITRTLKGAKQAAARKIAQRYTIPASVVTSTIKIQNFGLSGKLISSGSKIPIERFKIKPKVRKYPPPKGGIFAQVVKGQGDYLQRAFVQRSGGVYERTGRSRFPIHRFWGPSAPGMLSSPPVSSVIMAKIAERLNIEIDYAASYFFGAGGFLNFYG